MKFPKLVVSSFLGLYSSSSLSSSVTHISAFTPSSFHQGTFVSKKSSYSYSNPDHIHSHHHESTFPLRQQNDDVESEDVSYDDLSSWTVVELKDELKKQQLKVSGKKDELIQRLLESKEQQGLVEEEDETVATVVEEKQQEQYQRQSFSELNLIDLLQTSIALQGWEEPTPIQQLAIPTILQHFNDDSNNDAGGAGSSSSSLWAEAPTGSGKTGAFALPLIQLTLEERKRERNKRLSNRNSSSNSNQSQKRHQRHLGSNNRASETKNNNNINDNNNNNNNSGVTSLILCPTRELAYQIGGVIEELIEAMASKTKNIRDVLDVAVITGGVPMEPQIELLATKKMSEQSIDIIVATPGRLADVLKRHEKTEDDVTFSDRELEKRLLAALDDVGDGGGNKKEVSLSLAKLDALKINESIANQDDGGRSAIYDMLSNVKYLVLDEADRLLSPGFKTEMDEVLSLLPRAKTIRVDDEYGDEPTYISTTQMKSLLFSATFPEQIQPRVEQVLRRLNGRGAPPPIRLSCALAGMSQADDDEGEEASMRQRKRMERTTQPQAILEGPASTISLRTIRIEERDRTQALRRIINEYGEEEWDRVLVFVSTRYASEHVARKLRRYNIQASELHGKLDQDARIRRLEDFKRGKTRVLIATDLASRGLDVVGLPAVVNYDLPRSTADFTHRIGRTGRAGKKGIAVSFVTPTNEHFFDLIEKRHLQGSMVVNREVLKGFEPNEDRWKVKSGATSIELEGVEHTKGGLAHDRMFGGVKGRRKSKKDKLREKAAKKAAKQN